MSLNGRPGKKEKEAVTPEIIPPASSSKEAGLARSLGSASLGNYRKEIDIMRRVRSQVPGASDSLKYALLKRYRKSPRGSLFLQAVAMELVSKARSAGLVAFWSETFAESFSVDNRVLCRPGKNRCRALVIVFKTSLGRGRLVAEVLAPELLSNQKEARNENEG